MECTLSSHGRAVLLKTASASGKLANDPTIERCERRARQLGYGGFRACNIFALRETDPRKLQRARRPEGPDNLDQLSEAVAWADDILCAWGVHGAHLGQGERVCRHLRARTASLLTLGLTKDGHPRHPLYISYARHPEVWIAE